MKKLVVSFSGGKTSAFMAKWCLDNILGKEIVFVFANTGQEKEETLVFADKCDKYFGLNLVWLEADILKGSGNGTKHRIVNFETADRTGKRSFEPYIKKYGIPNITSPHCTRELKLRPIVSYLRSIGYNNNDYKTAIGIRADEIDRINPNYKKENLYYPLCDNKITKTDINNFWAKMPFNLNLEPHEGNCAWCWKKTFSKHMRLIKENPKIYEFPKEMEKKYGMRGAMAKKTGKPQVFFRNEKSVEDLFDDFKNNNNQPDLWDSCNESCEIDFM